ncbi:MAG: L28 family ribosomal protein [Candidatus Colwellbacteria bacterium]|jgi:ribosomal protein L28|nr:50S ribosomal protein L28 [Candidatus Colwellbacteria bacterium]MCK9497435.1 50S ribosomal protein L28 [Candidatus Colwellbacteria bacterium]MDD3752513.1 L28 family ribosomal protein [Candidatus Colwellbacteria bacterium]MDD4818857.1 L28 family ribosomal protein [Candidatus Colwellbacteria bacterium]
MRQCEICGKGSIMRGGRKKLRGNYNPTPKKRKHPNLQKTKLLGKKVLACTNCLKTINKEGLSEKK